jgi:hypothetical protein
MKQLSILLLVLILSNLSLIGQPKTISVDSVKFSYCEVFTKEIGLSGKVNIEINFGQSSKTFSNANYKSPVFPEVFSGIIDALNYMGKEGWEVVQVYSVLTGPSSMATYSYHYLLKKRIPQIKS